jgi:hypothetical protein
MNIAERQAHLTINNKMSHILISDDSSEYLKQKKSFPTVTFPSECTTEVMKRECLHQLRIWIRNYMRKSNDYHQPRLVTFNTSE